MPGTWKGDVSADERLACIVQSRDWRCRVKDRGEAAVPRGWNEALEDEARYDILRCGPGARRVPGHLNADVAFLECAADVRWAEEFTSRAQDKVWSSGLRLFDAAALCGRDMPGTGSTPLRACALRRIERQARNLTDHFVGGWERGYRFRLWATAEL